MKNIALLSAIVYTGISLLGAAVFLLATAWGSYTAVARAGGAVWVFILLMIILMPPVTTFFKSRQGKL
ncbi:hypothetical protein DGWBC_1482 [Dehalogenimonas sp. WBC-2]|nr:hypothetical protein DGWBC_1482 [Dehalogenimonas sp. WBC-2]